MTDIIMGNIVPLRNRIKELETQVETLKGVINRMYQNESSEREWGFEDDRDQTKYVTFGG